MPRIRIGVTLKSDVLDKLDKQREDVPRSTFIGRILERMFEDVDIDEPEKKVRKG